MAFHYAAALARAPVNELLRRRSGMRPVAAGLVTGASQSLILDETVPPSIGHLRGFAAHLAFGLAIAAVTEFGSMALGGRACTGRTPPAPGLSQRMVTGSGERGAVLTAGRPMSAG